MLLALATSIGTVCVGGGPGEGRGAEEGNRGLSERNGDLVSGPSRCSMHFWCVHTRLAPTCVFASP